MRSVMTEEQKGIITAEMNAMVEKVNVFTEYYNSKEGERCDGAISRMCRAEGKIKGYCDALYNLGIIIDIEWNANTIKSWKFV